MNAREKTLLSVALVLGVAGASTYWRLNRPTQESKGVIAKPGDPSFGEVPHIAKLRLVDEGEYSGDPLFGPRKLTAVIPQPAPPEGNGGLKPIPVPPPDPFPPTQPTPPSVLQRPPSVIDSIIDVPLIYSGFGRDDSGKITAFIETNGQGNVPVGHYNLKAGDFFIGRLQVTKITPETVEVEDMDRPESAAKRKQVINIRK